MAVVLYVDDEESIRRPVNSWLTRKGHLVYEASDITSAQAVVASHGESLDGVFIDLRLGNESGFQLVEWLRKTVPPLAGRIALTTGDLADGLGAVVGGPPIPVFRKPFSLAAIEAQAAEWGRARE